MIIKFIPHSPDFWCMEYAKDFRAIHDSVQQACKRRETSTRGRAAMTKYVLDSDQIKTLIEKAIDLFMDYQYRYGYEEPRARSETVMKIMETLRTIKKR